GHSYTWWVGAVGGQTTTWDSSLTFTVAPTTNGPSGAIKTLTPTFAWANVTGTTIDSYTVYLSDQAGGAPQVFTGLTGPSCGHVPPLAAGHSYTWWVGAVQGQNTTWSSGRTFSIPLTAVGPSSTISSVVPAFSWGPIAGVTQYTVYLSDQAGGAPQIFPS